MLKRRGISGVAFHLWRRTLIQPRFVSLTNPDFSHNLNIIAPSVSLSASCLAVCFPPAPPHSPGQLFPAPALGLMLLPLPPPLPPNHLLHSLVSTALTPLPWFVAPDFNATITPRYRCQVGLEACSCRRFFPAFMKQQLG